MRRVATALSLLSVFVAALVLPAASSASFPKTDEPLIVPGESIGGVAIGDKPTQAEHAWGEDRGNCSGVATGGCTYSRTGAFPLGAAYFGWSSGDDGFPRSFRSVDSVSITLGTDPDGDYVFDTKLTKFRTKKGIGLGSKKGAVKAAYPKARFIHGDNDSFVIDAHKGKGEIETSFLLASRAKGDPVTSISIRAYKECRVSAARMKRGC